MLAPPEKSGQGPPNPGKGLWQEWYCAQQQNSGTGDYPLQSNTKVACQGVHFSFSSNMNLLSIYKNHSLSIEKLLYFKVSSAFFHYVVPLQVGLC